MTLFGQSIDDMRDWAEGEERKPIRLKVIESTTQFLHMNLFLPEGFGGEERYILVNCGCKMTSERNCHCSQISHKCNCTITRSASNFPRQYANFYIVWPLLVVCVFIREEESIVESSPQLLSRVHLFSPINSK